MSDLINRRAAINAIADLPNCYNGFSDTYDKAYIIGVLEELPTIDAVPVRHGKWEDRTDNDDHYVYCSECGDEYIENDLHLDSWVKSYFKYCPNCGARMDEVDND